MDIFVPRLELFCPVGKKIVFERWILPFGKKIDFGKRMWYYVSLRRKERNG